MTEENTDFDFQKALKGIQEGKPFTGKDGVLTSLIKNLAEAALEGELDSHLGQEISANRRNGTFSPQIVKKHQTTLSDEIEEKIHTITPDWEKRYGKGRRRQIAHGARFRRILRP